VTDSTFDYTRDSLHCEGVSLSKLATQVGTPAFVYSAAGITSSYRAIDEALSFAPHMIAYAVKANSNLGVLAHLARLGSGADVVSGGELARAMKAGMPAERIVFSGVGKTDAEIGQALNAGIRSIHVESEGELEVIEHIAAKKGVVAPIAFRVNPDIDPKTHPYISTGLRTTKFGIAMDVASRLASRATGSKHLCFESVAIHIGSQLTQTAPLRDAVTRLGTFVKECQALGAPIRTIDAGGGWPASYGNERAPNPPFSDYGSAIRQGLEHAGLRANELEIVIEPGRSLVAAAGVLLTRVLFVKEQMGKRFVIVDAAMTELIRPALYQAYHHVLPVERKSDAGNTWEVDIVGPVCETADFLALERNIPPVQRGDLLAIGGAGAYSASMASNYNSRPRAAEVWVDGAETRVVRERETIEDLWRGEQV
jgi:diaminopimelate decarboxylase